MSTKVLIIDDTDPNIDYSGGSWTTREAITSTSHEYNNTLHRGDTNGQKITFTFSGTGISVYGSLDRPATNGLAGVQFLVDDMQPQQINATGEMTYRLDTIQTHQVLWKSPNLSMGTHTIQIEVTNATTTGPYFYFDFFTIETGLQSVAGHVILDDRDPSLTYFPTWIDSGITAEYMGTTAWPPNTGSYLTLEFNGTEIYVYGTQDSGPKNGAADIGFELDGGQQLIWTDPFPIPSSYAHNLYFIQTGLTDSKHTLKITALNDKIWTLDYIIYTTSNSSVNAAALGDGNGSGGIGGTGSTDGGGGGNGVSVGTPEKKSNTGAIAGGVVGGLLGIGALLLIAVLLLRRQKKNKGMSEKQFNPISTAPVSPSSAGNHGGPMMSATMPGAPYVIHNPSRPQPQPQEHYHHPQMMTQVQPQFYGQSSAQPVEPLQHQVQYSVIPASKNSSRNPLLEQPVNRPNPMTSGSSIVDSGTGTGDGSSHSAYTGITTEYSAPVEIDSGQRFRPPPSQTHAPSTITAPPVYTED